MWVTLCPLTDGVINVIINNINNIRNISDIHKDICDTENTKLAWKAIKEKLNIDEEMDI